MSHNPSSGASTAMMIGGAALAGGLVGYGVANGAFDGAGGMMMDAGGFVGDAAMDFGGMIGGIF
jgi:hypothetical protein